MVRPSHLAIDSRDNALYPIVQRIAKAGVRFFSEPYPASLPSDEQLDHLDALEEITFV